MPSVTVAAVEPTETAADTVAVGFFENEDIGHGLGQLTEAKAGLGKVAVTHAGGKRWLAVGLGRRSEFAIEPARIAAGAAWSRAQDLGAQTLAWALPGGVSAGGIVEGSVLAAHPVARYKSEPAEDTLTALVVCGADAAEADEARVLAEAVNAGRDLQNAPANVMTPTALATHARKLAAELGMTVDVLGREQLRAAGMGAFSAVAQGARQEPQLITLRYSPANAGGPTLALVGKAVTFDTGGISIKPGMKMSDMKFDMSGGAAVLAAMEAIARLALPVSVIGVVGATDNDVGSAAVKPGDIVRARSGTTIEILNTDAEGRLVLCDCLTHAIEVGADRLIDIATLTGGMIGTFGNTFAGLMGTDDAWCDAVLAASATAGESLWRLPLHQDYADLIKGTYADIVNVNEERKAGSIVAAEFLRKFVGDTPWVHLDIAGVAWNRGRSYAAKGGSGFGVRLMVEAARALS